MLCAPLWISERTLGALTLYAAQPAAFSAHDERIIELFATLAALALAEAQRTDHLRAALINRDVIGQAKGIIMERYKINARCRLQHTHSHLAGPEHKASRGRPPVVETGNSPTQHDTEPGSTESPTCMRSAGRVRC